MKAKVFIGSSVEGLNIAYGIQQNLEYDCNPTVWTQGIFQLSSITLDDLLKALENSDFGVFVFNPDDVTKIRNHTFETVRDNIIFEFGLFIGRLGKEKVFFVFPKSENNLHLPTDLLGITPGTYDNTRDDKNIIAALGPFCNQVRSQLKEFVYQNLNDLKDETLTVKKIAMEKPRYWEFLLALELLEPKLKSIKGSYEEIEKGLVFNKTTYLRTYEEFSNWFHGALKDLQKLISMFVPIIADELGKSFGPPGVAGNVLEIKTATDRIIAISKELLAWENRRQSVVFEDDLNEVKELMNQWSKDIFLELYKIPFEIRKIIDDDKEGKPISPIKLTLDSPKNVDKILDIFDEYGGVR